MLQRLSAFYRLSINNFLEACINIIIFLPYFFSVATLLKTLFHPWKNLVSKKTQTGFSFEEWLGRVGFNLISSLIGVFMRLSIILFYFIVQSIFLLIVPFACILYILLLPFLFLESQFGKTEEEKKELSRLKFLGFHLLNQENYSQVASWFELYYSQYVLKMKWWKKTHLFSLPPLARDWAVGFTPRLDEYGQDLTSFSYHQNTNHIVDREKEIDEIERVLAKSQEANVVVVGEEGVGKHTIIVALAKKMYEGKTKSLLMYRRIIKLNLEKILSEFSDLKQRERFFEDLLNEAAQAKNVIIYIDNIENYISIKKGGVDITSVIEKFAKFNTLQFMAVTTPFFYQKFFQTNESLVRLFAKINVDEVKKEEAEKILLQVAAIFESRYQLAIPYETIKNAIEKSEFYVTDIPFPEKAIDLLDSTCVLAKESSTSSHIVHPDLIDTILSEKTHVPTTLTKNMKDKLVHLEELLSQQVIHQDFAIHKLSSSLRRSFLLIGKRKKPTASLLFLGPTGVGKTESAKAVAMIFFGGDSYLTRFDMSNYQSQNDIPKLIGSLDTGDPGLLSKAVRESPYGVLLLDEIEKANKDLVNIFLTVLDEGYFTDGFGKRVDCKNLVIIATSNAGSDIIYKQIGQIGPVSLVDHLIEQKIFSPEFLNRFDGVITFNPLDQDSAKQIARNFIQKISEDIYNLHKVKVNVSDIYLSELIKRGYDEKFGARNLERLIRDEIEDKIAKLVLEGKVKGGESLAL
ncbi:ATP-dependent Clp protease ATP-binding subunit [Candidatus Roizmanbacteria bacterium]|nr:ATP-dependent Clp protease ATP-binding subunit [Candidatus Roizmanbacteria bacterium]